MRSYPQLQRLLESGVELGRFRPMIDSIQAGNTSPIWRGVNRRNTGPIVVNRVNPRRAANTHTMYMNLIDDNPMNRSNGFPRRSLSHVCSSNISRAADYGQLNLVVPLPGTKIGVVKGSDIWDVLPDVHIGHTFHSIMATEVGQQMAQRAPELKAQLVTWSYKHIERFFFTLTPEDRDELLNIAKKKYWGRVTIELLHKDQVEAMDMVYDMFDLSQETTRWQSTGERAVVMEYKPGTTLPEEGAEIWFEGPALYLPSFDDDDGYKGLEGDPEYESYLIDRWVHPDKTEPVGAVDL